MTLLTARPVRIGSERVIAVLGSARYSLKAGQRKTVTVKLFDDSQAGGSCIASASACSACC